MQLLAFMEAACQIRQTDVCIGGHINPGIWWGHSSFNTLDQECPIFRCWELNEQLIARERDNVQCGTWDGLVVVDDHRESACLLVPHIKEVFHL
jgi:hypothetical protein